VNSQAKAIEDVYEIVCNCLCRDHFIYITDLHIGTILSTDIKQELNLHIFPLIQLINSLMYLFENFTTTIILPLTVATISHSKVINNQKQIMYELERRIDLGLERAFTVICNQVKNVLHAEQKKNDFSTEMLVSQCTPACAKATHIIEVQIGRINTYLDGRNVNNALRDLGIKFHRCIYDHLLKYECNEIGKIRIEFTYIFFVFNFI
jgi:exocyst complex component 5